jgi:3-methyladenine DNA glycosylase/8-oxoguanine DNA glycosylase
VKTLFTTNIAWSGTIEMARKLVSLDPHGAFPTPAQVLAVSEAELTTKTGAGYRAPYLYELAQRIASGELQVEGWRYLDSDALYKAVTELTGFGDYAAGTMLRLLGHFDKLAIDTVARNAYETVTGHKPESDTDIRTHYEQYGQWRGLVLWMDCIQDQYVTPETAEATPEA